MLEFCPVCKPVHERLQNAYQTEEHLRELIRRLVAASSAAEPTDLSPRCGWSFERTATEPTGIVVAKSGEIALWATDPVQVETVVTQLARLTIRLGLAHLMEDASPSITLTRWNQALLSLRLDPPIMLGAMVAKLSSNGTVYFARAGLPSAILRRQNQAEELTTSGPYLGAFAAAFPTRSIEVKSGEELHLPGWILRREQETETSSTIS